MSSGETGGTGTATPEGEIEMDEFGGPQDVMKGYGRLH